MNLIAHRGVHNNKMEENTLLSFQKAINDPRFVGFELDVRMSKDKEFFVYHDYLYKGLPFKNYRNDYLLKEKILLLKEVLKLKTDKIILIEIKDYDIDIKKFLKLLNMYPKQNIYIMSFNNSIISKISNLTNEYKLGILNYVLNNELDYSYDFIGIINDLLKPSVIDSYKKKNIIVFSYGIYNKEKLKHQNVFYIIDSKLLDT